MYPATPEIYPYVHTLSLTDALPISVPRAGELAGSLGSLLPMPAFQPYVGAGSTDREPLLLLARSFRHLAHKCRASIAGGMRSQWERRSEEHTSELQSLMRISYAVFCLKKTTNNKATTL